MELISSITLAFGVLGFSALVAKWTLSRRKLSLPPGPTLLTVIRDLYKAGFSNSAHTQFEQWARRYGELFCVSIPGQTIIVINSVRVIRELFSGTYKTITNDRPPSFVGKYVFRGCGITFSSAGKYWRKLRQLFHSSVNMHVDGGMKIENTLRSEMKVTLGELNIQAESGTVQLHEIISDYLMNVLHILLTGERPLPGSDNIAIMREMDDLLNRSLGIDQESVLTNLPFLRHLPNSYGRRWKRIEATRAKLTKLFFTDYKVNFRSGDGVLDRFLEEASKEDSPVTKDDVLALIFELVAAGYVTSKSTLLGMMLMILHRPDIQQKLQKEISEAIGDRVPSLKDHMNTPYFDAFLFEMMRYTSQLPLGLPHMIREEIEYNGCRIPEKSMLLPNLYYMNHDPTQWKEPWQFRPERFLEEDGSLVSPLNDARQKFVQFGIGKRSCPGQNFARSRIFMFIASIFQEFDILPPDDEPLPSCNPATWEPGLILMPKYVRCKVRRRQTVPAQTE
ncbi:farnesoate epoxidase-like [Haliotis rubra]|uniref:farnesoate epoxidase-like n=1 Tax=Haliotis rubra TaxID=36100 RepID=UPI001EE628D9|nr:farnesoate epoxidase-like [Haliotis rubra]XP_046567028.1 farnesoate epoxidase-like [Haliotis rubra]XP_046575913.1 farnesoate epoxidase-like [Haliotis rubra]XP_046575914.1 farnesoate epoxidase-like [Haliotis rubra]